MNLYFYRVSKQELQRENKELKTEVVLLKEENSQLKKMLFKAKRERYEALEDPRQGKLFEDQSEEAVVQEEEKVVVKKKQTTTRKGIKRNRFPQTLKRETLRILPDNVEVEGLTKIGEDITELLAYRPASLYVKQIIRPRLVDKKEEDRGVFQASIPERIVPKGMVDESLIAELINEKIQFHTPIHRFSKKLKQAGVNFLKENNLHNWFHRGASALGPLYDLLIADVLAQGYIQSDETRMIVLAKNKIGASHRGQMWAFLAPTIKAVVFNYEPSRSTKSARVILDRFSGKLQVDGYAVYENIAKRKDIELSYCMAHARRKFYDAKDTAPNIANHFLSQVQLLYQIEQQCRDQQLDNKWRLKVRQEKALPILLKLKEWLAQQYADRNLLPKSLIRKAIDYALPRWKGLSAYAYDGKLEIDNNLVENTIRPIALGRKNYLFAGSHDAAQNLAILYSIVGTCLKHNINVFTYLHWILKKVATNKITSQAVDWLPHRVDTNVLSDFEKIGTVG